VPKNIHFALDKDFISPASARVLDRVAQVLQENPTIIIELEGHTDPRASDAYNLALGARRARNTRNYLLRKGIANERMTIRSFGERQPVSPGRTKLDYALDRRVEINYKDARDIEVIVQEEDLQIEP
jgi:outer membrane protein OmpA-like peptidoglycan-associated protein